LQSLDESTLLSVFEGVPQSTVQASALKESVVDFLSESSNNIIFSSKGEARRMIKGGGVSINKEKVIECEAPFITNLLQGKYILVQKGKKNYYLLTVV